MVRHEVDNHLQIGLMTTFYKVSELLHAAAFVLAQVGVNIVVVGDSVWTAGFAFDNSRGVILRSGMANNACVPHMRCAQVADSAQGFGGNGIQGT